MQDEKSGCSERLLAAYQGSRRVIGWTAIAGNRSARHAIGMIEGFEIWID